MTILANNYYGLWMQDIILTPWKLAIVVLVILLLPAMIYKMVLVAIWIFMFLQLVNQYFFRFKSRRLGLNFFTLLPGPKPILNFQLAKHNIYVDGGYFELHVRIKKYPDMEVYNEHLIKDARILKRLVENGKLTGNIVLNTFNRQAVNVLAEIFSETNCRVIRKKSTCLTMFNLTGWKGRRFQRMQKKMFGRVLSYRNVGNPEEWELLIISPS